MSRDNRLWDGSLNYSMLYYIERFVVCVYRVMSVDRNKLTDLRIKLLDLRIKLPDF